MTQVKEEKISNEKLRGIFYNIPDAHRLIAVKQLTFTGKVVRRETLSFPNNFSQHGLTINGKPAEYSLPTRRR